MMTTRKRKTPPMGLEPTTFELEVQRATIAPRGSTTHLFEPQRVTHTPNSIHKLRTVIPLTTMN